MRALGGRAGRRDGTVVQVQAGHAATAGQFESIFAAAPIALGVLDVGRHSVRVNRKAVELFGWTEAELAGGSLLSGGGLGSWLNDQLRAAAPEVFDETLAGRPIHFETLELRRHDGALLSVRGEVAPIREETGRLIGLVMAFVDMTDERRVVAERDHAYERLRRFVDANIVGIVVADAAGVIIEANDYYLDLLGVTRATLERGELDWRAVTPPEWIAADDRAIAELRERGVTAPYEKEYLRRDGRRVPVLIADTLLPGPGDEIAAFVMNQSDRKDVEHALLVSENRLRGSLNLMRDPFVICSSIHDAGGAITGFRVDFANHAAGAFMGRDLEALSGASMPNGLIWLGDLPFLDSCRAVVASGIGRAEHAVEFGLHGKGGRERWLVDIQIAKFGDGFFAAWRDVTEPNRLAREHERLAAVVAQSNDAIAVTDPDGRIVYANPAFETELGMPLVEIVGKAMPAIMVTALDPATIMAIDQRVATGQGWLGEVDERRADGPMRHVEVSVTPTARPEARSRAT